ncbi:hypothetical protein ACIQWN_38380 [Streptomyces vinaceus]|uniref:hypothetical protein n=1 Tax=Streptomyces vinaceus TaxID=1960 RepID=UPI00380D9C64
MADEYSWLPWLSREQLTDIKLVFKARGSRMAEQLRDGTPRAEAEYEILSAYCRHRDPTEATSKQLNGALKGSSFRGYDYLAPLWDELRKSRNEIIEAASNQHNARIAWTAYGPTIKQISRTYKKALRGAIAFKCEIFHLSGPNQIDHLFTEPEIEFHTLRSHCMQSVDVCKQPTPPSHTESKSLVIGATVKFDRFKQSHLRLIDQVTRIHMHQTGGLTQSVPHEIQREIEVFTRILEESGVDIGAAAHAVRHPESAGKKSTGGSTQESRNKPDAAGAARVSPHGAAQPQPTALKQPSARTAPPVKISPILTPPDTALVRLKSLGERTVYYSGTISLMDGSHAIKMTGWIYLDFSDASLISNAGTRLHAWAPAMIDQSLVTFEYPDHQLSSPTPLSSLLHLNRRDYDPATPLWLPFAGEIGANSFQFTDTELFTPNLLALFAFHPAVIDAAQMSEELPKLTYTDPEEYIRWDGEKYQLTDFGNNYGQQLYLTEWAKHTGAKIG